MKIMFLFPFSLHFKHVYTLPKTLRCVGCNALIINLMCFVFYIKPLNIVILFSPHCNSVPTTFVYSAHTYSTCGMSACCTHFKTNL